MPKQNAGKVQKSVKTIVIKCSLKGESKEGSIYWSKAAALPVVEVVYKLKKDIKEQSDSRRHR